MNQSAVKFKALHPSAIIPKVQSPGAAGFDLYADEGALISAGEWKTIPTGVGVVIPPGFVGQIWPRSGLAVKAGLDTGAGIIDSDFRGYIGVVLFNHSNSVFPVQAGERIAQLVVVPCITLSAEVDEWPPTERGAGGFGSTGR